MNPSAPDSKPRLAFISPLGFGGATTFLCNLTAELSRRGVPVMVLSLEKANAFASNFEANKVPVVCQDEGNRLFEDRIDGTRKALANFRPTAVFACLGSSSYEVLRYVPAGVQRFALVHADHAMFYDAIAPYAPFIDEVIGVSEQICATVGTLPGFSGKPIHYLTSGVMVPQFNAPRAVSPEDPLRILYLGRLENVQKRVRLFPEILAQLVDLDLPFKWTVVGEGPDLPFLEEAMRTDRRDQVVEIVGGMAYDEIPGLLAEHDVILLTSVAEGLPMSLMEAMAFGVVPVASDLPSGIRQLIDKESGILVPPDTTSGYGEAILWLHQHREELQRMSRRGQQKIRAEFSVSALSSRWLSLVDSPPSGEIDWPLDPRIQAPLNYIHPLQFLPLLRPLRRLVLRWRKNRKREF